ncbi:MAG: protein kinase [Acidobacteriota bacterium]|nr:protein kinase [Acidobacteriota bacterium]
MRATFPTVGAVVPGPSDAGDLRLVEVLGAGAFGIVFRAEGEKGDIYAVKFLQAGLLATQSERQTLFNEVLAGSQVSHPNVLQVFMLGQEGAFPPYVVTEFANNGTLFRKIEDARNLNLPFTLEVIKHWCLDIAAGMEAINSKVLHRDLKPDNILFVDNTLKIADFGLAKLVGAATRSVTFKGGQHVLYMAPEGWEGKSNTIQLDMYSAGIVFFEIATLKYPYTIPTTGELDQFRRMHVLNAPMDARSLRPDLPRRFDEVLARLLEKRPDRRYESWAAVTAALTAAFDREAATLAAPVSPLLEEASKRHHEATERRLREEAEVRKADEEAEIDAKQEGEIIRLIEDSVKRFNDSTEGPKASLVRETGGWRIHFPYAAAAKISFFAAYPPLKIPPFEVRHMALLEDTNGCGFNLLLRRRAGDIYGEWVVCRVRTNPLTDSAYRNCKYFGLDSKNAEHIERGLRAMHIYIPEVTLDVDVKIEEFLRSLYRTSI